MHLTIRTILVFTSVLTLSSMGCSRRYEPVEESLGSILVENSRYYIDARYIEVDVETKTVVTSIIAISSTGSMPPLFNPDKGVYSLNGIDYRLRHGDNLIILDRKSKLLKPFQVDSARTVIEEFVKHCRSKP